jgi:hypothetical protein
MKDPTVPRLPGPLEELPPESPIYTEWNVFRRELPRLLAEGHEGRWVLIKGEEVIGLFDDWREARHAGAQRFGLVPMLVQQVLSRPRALLTPIVRLCRPLPYPFNQTDCSSTS